MSSLRTSFIVFQIGPNGTPVSGTLDNVYLEPIGMKYPPPYNEYNETPKRSKNSKTFSINFGGIHGTMMQKILRVSVRYTPT